MGEWFKQFILLTTKNCILAKRSKLWTFFELVIPILFTFPVVILIVKNNKVEISDAKIFDIVPLAGNSSDISRTVGFVSSIRTRWCNQRYVRFAYTTVSSDADDMMKRFANRYNGVDVVIDVVRFGNEASMLNELRADAPNNTRYGCSIHRFAGGVAFTRFNISYRVLEYRILIPVGLTENNWDLNKDWDDPFGASNDQNRIPGRPPYWSSAFLTFQHAIDSLFIDMVSRHASEQPEVYIRRLPEPQYTVNSVAAFLSFLPLLWGLCSFLTVIHAAREVAYEKSTVKVFLSVMGLSNPMFYLSHIIFAWIKCTVVFLVCAVPLCTVLGSVHWSLFLCIVVIYGLGAVTFGVMIASIFKASDSALKVTIVLWIIMVGVNFKAPRVEEVFLCFAYSCININGAFFYALTSMADYMNRDRSLSWINLFEGGSFHFNIGFSMIMMIVDVIWMLLVTLMIDWIAENNYSSCLRSFFLNYRFIASYSSNRLDELDGSTETDVGLNQSQKGIEVERLIKIWGSTGERAVDEVSLVAHAGQVTILLGHNGAGKSTTFSIISGIIAPTAGKVLIYGNDVTKSPYGCREKIGLCPQNNALFDMLTTDEHLWLIHGLKGASGSYTTEADNLLEILKLTEKREDLTINLSGGQKRKLCVCLALIGGSKVVLLDEPTAGMDPGARRDVEILLEWAKRQRTILLTTHYMDEAELLGDRVAIMAKGRIVCCGSPQFLKKRFGTGYVMTVVVSDKANSYDEAERLVAVSQRYVVTATMGTVHGKQLEIILPKEEQKNFPELFEHLEEHKESLGISSFGLSLNTLEQVFLRVGEMSDPENGIADVSLNEEIINSQNEERLIGRSLMLSQLRAVITKRMLYSIRNWPQLATQLLIPLGILIVVAYVSSYKQTLNSDASRSFTIEKFGISRIPVHIIKPSNVSKYYLNIASLSGMVTQLSDTNNLTVWVESLPKELPAPGLGAVFGEKRMEVLFNNRALHSLPTSLNLMNNARLRAETEGLIRTGIYIYSPPVITSMRLLSSGIIDAILGPLLVLALALLTSTFVMFLVEERRSKFAHQQLLTGISPVVFWAGSLFYDFAFYSFACFLFIIVFLISSWMEGYIHFVLLMWALYFWSCIPFIYSVSFVFSSPTKANVLMVIWQIGAAFAAMFMVFMVGMLNTLDDPLKEFIRSVLLFFLPSFSLGNALMTLGTSSASGTSPSILWQWDELGKNIMFMFLFGCFSSLLFISFQFKSVRRHFSKLWDIQCGRKSYSKVGTDEEDSAVTQERLNVSLSCEDLALEVRDLCKVFGHTHAVNGLTLGVRNKECFGLLGVNGAGKTTTFDILTGQKFATHGTARIDNKDVIEQIAIGYCPQFDALMLDLTGRETLELLARMHGFVNPSSKASIVLQSVGMEEHADKLVRYYSGGQRRKISVGLALLAPTRIVILDEPTAGIDPKARREIWNLLSMVRDSSNSAMLLTSHSMDECEALCSRIAILQKGKLLTIGSSQQLKSRFGNSYTLSMVVPTTDLRNDVMKGVAEWFPQSVMKTHKDSQALTLKWQISRSPSDRWSSLFRQVLDLANHLRVTEFCIAQSSLEETFLRLANQDEADN